MASITIPKTWADNENVTYTDLNSGFSTIYNDYNGNIEDANVAADAAVAESKVAFNTSTGHSHNGTDSKAIPKGFVWTIANNLLAGTSSGPILIATQAMTLTKWYLNVKTAPTGASLIIDINKNGTSIFNTHTAYRPTVAISATSGSGTDFDTTSLAEGDVLTIDIDQIGSTVSGADVTLTLKG